MLLPVRGDRMSPRAQGRNQLRVRPRLLADDKEGGALVAERLEDARGRARIRAVVEGQSHQLLGGRAGARAAECRSHRLAPQAQHAQNEESDHRETQGELGPSWYPPEPEIEESDNADRQHRDMQPARPPWWLPGQRRLGGGWLPTRRARILGRAPHREVAPRSGPLGKRDRR